MSAHAVVIGGSMAGLFAARVLADRFERVTVLERDTLPPSAVHRAGVPQSHHSHVMLARGREIAESLFPGLDAELAAAGAPLLDWGLDCLVVSPCGPVPKFASGLLTRACSRPLLEHAMRERLCRLPNVTARAGTSVTALAGDAARVTGVVLAGGSTLDADLVIDASGRRSRVAEWLAGFGLPTVETTTIDAGLGYATRLYLRRSEPWQAVICSTVPPKNPRAAGLWPIEGDRWLVTLAGTARCYPPQDEAGFLSFAAELATPEVHRALSEAEPISAVRGFRDTANVWRHFERLGRWPDGLVVMGDALCAFNPIYGQGMSVAALEALSLGRQLGRLGAGARGLAASVQRALPDAIAPAWLLATSEDCRWPDTIGARNGPLARLSNWYVDRVMRRAANSTRAAAAFLGVMHMVRKPLALAHPAIAVPLFAQAVTA